MTVDETRAKILRSTFWTTKCKIVSQALGLVTTLILARLLAREDFGLMAMAIAFVGLIDTFIDIGFLSAIIQAKDIRRTQLSSCFWVLMAFSGILTLLTLLSASLIADAFGARRIESFIPWLAPLFLLSPFQIVGKGILSRELRIDALAKIELIASLSKMAVSIFLAMLGFGVLSLVISFIFERMLLTAGCVLRTRWTPRFEFEGSTLRHLFSFGSQVTVSSMLWYIYTKADVFVIGRILGTELLGAYTIAAQFPQTIARFVPSTWHRILYPLFARYQDSQELGRIVTHASSFLSLVSLPLFLGMAAVAPDIIDMLFGPGWQAAVFPLQMLSIAAAIETVTWVLTASLNAVGRPGVNTLINLVAVTFFPAAYYIGALQWGMAGVLWAYLAAFSYRFLAFLWSAKRSFRLSLSLYVKNHRGSLVASCAMMIVVIVLQSEVQQWNIIPRIATCISFGAVTYVSVLLLLSRDQIAQFLSYVRAS